MASLLLADDDREHAALMRVYAEADGHRLTHVHDGRSALSRLRADGPDLVILDVVMPGVGGLEACRLIRAESRVPILMLTGLGDEDDRVRGLDLGADDYLVKPFSPRELMSRVRGLLRRVGADLWPATRAAEFGDLLVDPRAHRVTVGGVPVPCTRGEFALLAALTARSGRVVSRGELVESVLAVDDRATERTIDAHVSRLRRKLDLAAGCAGLIATVRGLGYRLARGGRES